jgi:hypothetical protein
MENVIVTFADGTTLTAVLNGNSLITDTKPSIPDNLSIVTITGDETNETIMNARLVECASVDGRYWVTFQSIPASEIEKMKTRSDIDYIALMCDVEL